ncbi:hypothetical protein K1T71_006887 [Dendrolimus kikuchii]|uniref:Uncharacterized protein n=1 Tax=Dendrolimus kikuchii TaxID=765133 RepID=A0ACC1D2R7_9NEOP|nr:hypothetical protein K1T71_006887 [Dendrolimus kikuchii]
MAPLRLFHEYTDIAMDFLNFSTQTPSHEIRHHVRHHNRSHSREGHKNHVVDILSNTIIEAMSTKFVSDSNVLPDMEPLSTHIDENRHNTMRDDTMNRSDFNGISDEFLYRHSGVMTAVYCAAYLLVFIVGLVGNCFVIAVVYRSPRMRTVTNFFIVNLAVADILVIVFCLPATLMSNIFVRKYLVLILLIFSVISI